MNVLDKRGNSNWEDVTVSQQIVIASTWMRCQPCRLFVNISKSAIDNRVPIIYSLGVTTEVSDRHRGCAAFHNHEARTEGEGGVDLSALIVRRLKRNCWESELSCLHEALKGAAFEILICDLEAMEQVIQPETSPCQIQKYPRGVKRKEQGVWSRPIDGNADSFRIR